MQMLGLLVLSILVQAPTDPGRTAAELNLANAYAARFVPGTQSEQNWEFAAKAIEGFQNVLRLEPNNIDAIRGLAQIYQNANDPRKARQYH